MMAKLHKVEYYILDYNDEFRTPQQVKGYLHYSIHGVLLEHLNVTTTDIGEWHDDHPLNIVDCPEAEFKKYFKEN